VARQLNSKTVAKAYKLLERDSIIEAKGYRGTYVHPKARKALAKLARVVSMCQVSMGRRLLLGRPFRLYISGPRTTSVRGRVSSRPPLP